MDATAPSAPAEARRSRARLMLLYWLPIGLYVAIVFALSSLSSLPFSLPPIRHLDKLAHLAEYAVLALLLARALRAERPGAAAWKLWLGAVLLVAALGGLDELYQRSVPRRDADLLDLLADVLGGMTGAAAYLAARRLLGRR